MVAGVVCSWLRGSYVATAPDAHNTLAYLPPLLLRRGFGRYATTSQTLPLLAPPAPYGRSVPPVPYRSQGRAVAPIGAFFFVGYALRRGMPFSCGRVLCWWSVQSWRCPQVPPSLGRISKTAPWVGSGNSVGAGNARSYPPPHKTLPCRPSSTPAPGCAYYYRGDNWPWEVLRNP